jgi:predicted nucleic acid-binding protein
MARRRRSHHERSAESGKTVFVDTSFWIALLATRDQYGDRALQWKAWLLDRGCRLLTTEFVMWETLNALAVPDSRARAAVIYRQCQQGKGIQLVRFDSGIVDAALALYESRPDKSWSLTDCHSFRVMQSHALTDSLTADRHFQQAGFRALLLHRPPADS